MGQAPGFVPFGSSPEFTLRMFRSGIEQPARDAQNSRKPLIQKGFP